MFCLGLVPLKAGQHQCKAAAIKAASSDKRKRPKAKRSKKENPKTKKPQWARSVVNNV